MNAIIIILFFEFIDPTVEFGQVYYYSLWVITSQSPPWNHRAIYIGNEWQMVVDVNEVLGAPEIIECELPEPEDIECDTPEPAAYIENYLSDTILPSILWTALITVWVVVIIVLVIFFVFYRGRRR